MLHHISLGNKKFSRKRKLLALIKSGEITLGGHSRLKIYGRLDCKSGMRMNPANRNFFSSKKEAQKLKYRPCGNCLRKEYQNWNDLRNGELRCRFKATK